MPAQDLLDTEEGPGYQVAATGGGRILVYSPLGEPIRLAMDTVPQQKHQSRWWNPRDGAWSDASARIAGNRGEWTPPSKGRGHDWLLVIE